MLNIRTTTSKECYVWLEWNIFWFALFRHWNNLYSVPCVARESELNGGTAAAAAATGEVVGSTRLGKRGVIPGHVQII